jgi:CysZ protein
MLRAFTLAIGQLGDRAFLGVLAKSLAVTLLIFAAAGTGLVLLAGEVTSRFGWDPEAGFLAQTLALIASLAALWLLFRAVSVPVMGFFADEVIAAVERKHYPGALFSARAVSIALSIRMALTSLLRVVGFNLLALPLYLLLIPTGIGFLITFASVNALLLGRDLGEMVATRHVRGGELNAWLRGSRPSRALLGLGVTALFMVPLANFLAPIIGAAMATHLFHGDRQA